jgi:multicomponent Na+:H+ antiporter subunit D
MTALYFAAGMASRLCGGAEGLDVMRGIYQKNVFLAAISLMLFFAVSGLPPFSGFWPKLMLVKVTIEGGPWWSTASILITGFLTMIAVGRVWALTYWKPTEEDAAPSSLDDVKFTMIDYIPLTGLTVIIVALGIYPEPMFQLVYEAADQLVDPSLYIDSVFGSEAAQ